MQSPLRESQQCHDAFRWLVLAWLLSALSTTSSPAVDQSSLDCTSPPANSDPMVESHPDPYYKMRFLFKELAYIRQPKVVGYLQKYLYDDECPPPWEGTTAYSYATSAAAALSKMLEGVPARPAGVPSPDDVAKLREWMARRTEWKLIR